MARMCLFPGPSLPGRQCPGNVSTSCRNIRKQRLGLRNLGCAKCQPPRARQPVSLPLRGKSASTLISTGGNADRHRVYAGQARPCRPPIRWRPQASRCLVVRLGNPLTARVLLDGDRGISDLSRNTKSATEGRVPARQPEWENRRDSQLAARSDHLHVPKQPAYSVQRRARGGEPPGVMSGQTSILRLQWGRRATMAFLQIIDRKDLPCRRPMGARGSGGPDNPSPAPPTFLQRRRFGIHDHVGRTPGGVPTKPHAGVRPAAERATRKFNRFFSWDGAKIVLLRLGNLRSGDPTSARSSALELRGRGCHGSR